jgi:hypothetical protein
MSKIAKISKREKLNNMYRCEISSVYKNRNKCEYKVSETSWCFLEKDYVIEIYDTHLYYYKIVLPSFNHRYFKYLKNIKELAVDNANETIPDDLFLPNLKLLRIMQKTKNRFIILNDSMKNLQSIIQNQYSYSPILFIPENFNIIQNLSYCIILFGSYFDTFYSRNHSAIERLYTKCRFRVFINKQIRQRKKFNKLRIKYIYHPNYLGGYLAKKRISNMFCRD